MEGNDLHGLTAVVTGAGGGVGRAVARMLAGSGANAAIADIREEPLRETRRGAGGERMLPVRMNVADEEEVAAAFRSAESRFGGVDIVVHCAAIWDEAEVGQIDAKRLDRMLDINLKGGFFVCREAFAAMRKHGRGGVIVTVASTAGEYGSIRPAAHYAASKGGIIAMSKSLAREGAADRIRVNVVSPGPLDTPMTAITSEAQRQAMGERTLLGRVGMPEDIASAVLFLASPASSWITGEVLRVNGGSLL